jgi:hypothetical protein
MQFAQLIGVTIEPVRGLLHLVEVVAMIAGRRPFLGALAHDAQLVAAKFDHFVQCFLKSHEIPFAPACEYACYP